jgi:hypothetical protein
MNYSYSLKIKEITLLKGDRNDFDSTFIIDKAMETLIMFLIKIKGE